ncbi:MAG: hypothetical protein CBARDCOR_3682 [uncultured Caballeronia sp.]|nr:MAG: hypothetical protein CBARDCOR_3682 [uncultured Caballeronia sp.]
MSDLQPYQRLRQETVQLTRTLSREPNATALIDATDHSVTDTPRKSPLRFRRGAVGR